MDTTTALAILISLIAGSILGALSEDAKWRKEMDEFSEDMYEKLLGVEVEKDMVSRELRHHQEQTESVKEAMCDHYCRYSADRITDEDEINKRCESCPLNRL